VIRFYSFFLSRVFLKILYLSCDQLLFESFTASRLRLCLVTVCICICMYVCVLYITVSIVLLAKQCFFRSMMLIGFRKENWLDVTQTLSCCKKLLALCHFHNKNQISYMHSLLLYKFLSILAMRDEKKQNEANHQYIDRDPSPLP
jgi:hypothetical protein